MAIAGPRSSCREAAAVTTAAPIAEAATACEYRRCRAWLYDWFCHQARGAIAGDHPAELLVDLTNQAYANSQVNGQIRLVQTVQVNYPDATSNRTALFELTGVTCVPSTGRTQTARAGVNCTPWDSRPRCSR